MSRKEPQEPPEGIEKPEPPFVEFTNRLPTEQLGVPAFAVDPNDDFRILRCDAEGNVLLAESALARLEEMFRKIAGEVVREELAILGLYPEYFGRAEAKGPETKIGG